MTNHKVLLTVVALAVLRLSYADTALPSSGATLPPGWQPAPELRVPFSRPGSASTGITTTTTTIDGQIIRGSDRLIALPRAGVVTGGTANSFKFEDAPLSDVVHVIMRDILKVDYVIHSQLGGNVTLATRAEVSADQAVYLLESVLLANGATMARDARGVYHIGRPESLTGIVAAPRVAGNGVLPPGTGTIVVPLQYIGAAEMAAILRPLLPPNALVRVDPTRNLLIVAGSRTQAEGWLDIVSTFDVDLLKGMSVGVFPLKNASVREVDTALRMMMQGGAVPVTPAAGAAAGARINPQATPSAAAGIAASPENSFFGAIRVMPIERINSLLVVSPRAAYLEDARLWIERLDRPGTNSFEPQLHIYPVRNGSARHLAEVLSSIFGEATTTGNSASPAVAPGLTPVTRTTGSVATPGTLSGNSQLGTSQTRAATSTTTSRGARVVADELNNAVLVYSLPSEYEKIEGALRRLDLPPTQVLIEASIIEVTLGDELRYGLQWYFTDKARGGLQGTGVLVNEAGVVSQVAQGVLGAVQSGFSYTLSNSLGQVRAVLNALADKSLVKVISSPSLMVLDNHTAGISVGTQQPIQSSETITSGGNVSTSIQYKDTGVNLQVTPSVSADNIVTMQINQAVTDVGLPDVGATGQRSFLQRQIASKVAVRSGETLVLGGLIRDNASTGKAGLPLLSEIPVFGALFGTQSRTASRTELLVIITPRVVRSDIDVRDIGAELRERMRSFPANDMFRRP